MQIKVLYSSHYFERDLFLLEIDGHYTTVYRGSGLNGGRKGKILPYTGLNDRKPTLSDMREGIVPGYIYKEFFYRGFYKSHKKNLNNFPEQIGKFADELEKLLENYKVEAKEQDINNVLKIAKEINTEVKKRAKGLKPFDWFTLALPSTLSEEITMSY